MHLVADLQICIASEGEGQRLTATVQAVKDGNPIGEPSVPIILANGQVITYGPVGLECTVESKLEVEEGQYPQEKPEGAPKGDQPQERPLKPGQAQLAKQAARR